MKILHVIAAMLTLSLVASGCSSSESSTNVSGNSDSTVSSATPDEVLQNYVNALAPFKTLGDTDGNPATEFQQVSAALGPLAGSLTDGIIGVPEDISNDAAVTTGSLAVSIDIVVECLSTSPTNCEPFVNNTVDLAQDMGRALARIVPYSSWALDELSSRL